METRSSRGLSVCLDLPARAFGRWDEWLGGHALAELGAVLDASGIGAVSLSDHPVPPDSWLAVGGHQSMDPFAFLSHLGACTSRVRLMTNLVVAGYRSPYVTAKAAATVDVLSQGRLTLGLGAGYVTEEFAAVGADFHRRGRDFDAAIASIRESWSGQAFASSDGGPTHTVLPRPRQVPHPPIWIGGNSAAARRRAARLADGWIPFLQNPEQAAVTGTDALGSLDEVAVRVSELNAMAQEHGRPGPMDVCLSASRGDTAESFASYLNHSGAACVEAGVTWLLWQPGARSFEALVDQVAELGIALRQGAGVG